MLEVSNQNLRETGVVATEQNNHAVRDDCHKRFPVVEQVVRRRSKTHSNRAARLKDQDRQAGGLESFLRGGGGHRTTLLHMTR